MARNQRIECVRADAQKFGIAKGHKLGGMRFARNQRHFADRFARRDMGHKTPAGFPVVHEHAKRTGDDQEQRLIVFAVARQHGAAGQSEPVGLRQQTDKGRISQIGEQGKTAQPRTQRFRINCFPPRPE